MEAIYYTPKEVAERLKLRVQTVYDYIRKGRLPAVRLGNRCRIAHSDLEAFLARQYGVGSAVAGTEDSCASLKGLQPAAGSIATDQSEQSERNEAARRLLAEWLADESGYDERVWPVVERLLQENPVSVGELQHEHE